MRARMSLVLVTIAAVVVLTACGGGGGDASDDASGGSRETPASESTRRPTRTPAATTVAGPKPPGDVCALVTAEETKRFAPEMGAPRSIGHDSTPNTSVGCRWNSSGTGDSFGRLTVEVYTPEAIGRKPDTIKAALESRALEGEEVPGIGEFTIISVNAVTAEANAMVKGVVVRVEWSGGAPAARRDTVIELLKSVVGKIE